MPLPPDIYKSLVENSTLPVIFFEHDGGIIDATSPAWELFCYTVSEMRQLKVSDIIESFPITGEIVDREDNWLHKTYGIRKNGERFRLSYSKPTQHCHDGIKYACVVVNDVSEITKLEQELGLINNYTREPYVRLDIKLHILTFNRQFQHLYIKHLGVKVERGHHILDYAQSDRHELQQLYDRVLTGATETSEIDVPDFKGTSKTFSLTYAPAIDERNTIVGVFITARDISLEKESLRSVAAQTGTINYNHIFEHAGDAIIIHELNGNFVDVNQKGCELFGADKETILKSDLARFSTDTPGFTIGDISKNWAKAAAGEQSRFNWIARDVQSNLKHVEVSLRRANLGGTERIIAILRVSKGNVHHTAVELNDLMLGANYTSGKDNADQAILSALAEKNTILESIGYAFFAVDKNWNVTYLNKVAEIALGKSKKEMIGNNLWGVFSGNKKLTPFKKYRHAMEQNEALHFEDYFEGLNTWYEISAFPSPDGLSVYFKDISYRKLSEIKLNELNEDLQRQSRALAISNAELEQFAYVASHDLQEPLRMVTSFVTQLEKKYSDVLDQKGKKYIAFAVDGARRMRQIIKDLLEYSKLGTSDETTEMIDFEQVIDDIIVLYRTVVTEKNARITTEGLPILRGHISPIRQVFQNLISNALKYSRKDVMVQIHIRGEELEHYWQFEVHDNGIGIEKEYFEKIFIIFQRLHSREEFTGTGLGLAITKKIIDGLGGKIWLESEELRGSTFYFTIAKNKII